MTGPAGSEWRQAREPPAWRGPAGRRGEPGQVNGSVGWKPPGSPCRLLLTLLIAEPCISPGRARGGGRCVRTALSGLERAR
jgi:hypothetical protein